MSVQFGSVTSLVALSAPLHVYDISRWVYRRERKRRMLQLIATLAL